MTSKTTLCLLASGLLFLGCDKKEDSGSSEQSGSSEKGDKDKGDGDGGGGGDKVEAGGGKKIVAIDVGSLASCALMEGGTVRCWGGNIEGQLGVGKMGDDFLESYTPVEVKGVKGAKTLWFGGSYSWGGGHSDGTTDTGCVQMGDGKVKCWGHNGLIYGDGEHKHLADATDVAALAG